MFKDKNFMKIMFVWLAILGSLFVYVLLAFIMKNSSVEKKDLTNYEMMLGIFAFLSLISGTISVLVRKNLLKEKFYKKMQGPYQNVYLITIIISTALAESIAVYGLILFFMTLKLKIFLVFCAVSFSIMILNKPNAKEFMEFKAEFNKENIE